MTHGYPTAHSPTSDERSYVALFLLSLALRPHPDGSEPSAVRLDRADLWTLASAAGAPLGRNRFHAATAALAEDDDGDGWDGVVFVTRERCNRWSVTVVRPDADPDGWDEALDGLGLTLDSASEAARQLALDTTSPLPGERLLPLPAVDEDDEDAEDAEDDDTVPTKVCTHCHVEKPATDAEGEDGFPLRVTGRLSSWCRACTRAATAAATARRRPRRGLVDPVTAQIEREIRRSRPTEKHCAACTKWLPRAAFYRDAQKHDGLMTICGSCHDHRRHRQRQRVGFTF